MTFDTIESLTYVKDSKKVKKTHFLVPASVHSQSCGNAAWNYDSSFNSATFRRIFTVALMMSSISSSVPIKTF